MSNPNEKWYVAYTFPKAEKKVFHEIRRLGIETFLPLHKVVHQWSDRRKRLTVPLFPNYVFVKMNSKNIYDLLRVEGLVNFINFNGELGYLSEDEIELIKKILKTGTRLKQENSFFQTGQKVVIDKGPLMGIEGMIVRVNGNDRLLIEIEGLRQYISVEVSSANLKVKPSNQCN